MKVNNLEFMTGLIVAIIVGGIAGFLAGQIRKGSGYGFFGNIVVGIIGAFVGSLVLGLFGIQDTNIIGEIIVATLGALIFLAILNALT